LKRQNDISLFLCKNEFIFRVQVDLGGIPFLVSSAQDLHGQGILDFLLDYSLERAGFIDRIIALARSFSFFLLTIRQKSLFFEMGASHGRD
jgi:hypothetical protein